MRLGEHDEDYIWLRQSATFVVNGQTRTVEIAIPVRRGCTPAELESLLDEADAGMARLSRHLDARIAEQQGAAPPAPPLAEPTPRPAPAASERAPAPATHPAPLPGSAAAPPPAPMPPSIAERPAPPPRTPPPAAPAPRSASVPSPAPTERPRPAPPAATGEPLTIAAFLAAASAELGYNARQAMDELGVRTLSGLNLREALETLRRKHVRAGAAPLEAPPPPAHSTRPTPVPAPAPEPPAPASPRYFDEEDDADYTFDLEDEAALAPEDSGHLPDAAFGALAEDEPPPLGDDDFDLAGDLPDFDALPPPPEEPAPAPPARSRPAPGPRAATSRASTAAATPASARSTGPLAGAEHMRGLPRLGQLRAVAPGSAATAWQRNAYHNLVVSQLGEEAARLVAGVWSGTPAQLGGDQLDALIRWAKEDAFQEEARQVLAAISAERARAVNSAHSADGAGGADGAAPPRATGRASASGAAPRRAASPRSRDGEGGR